MVGDAAVLVSRTRPVVLVAVALLVLLAGCGGSGGGPATGAEPTPATTSTSTTTEPTPTGPSLGSIDYPAGLGEDGYRNTTLALETFRDGLASGPAYAVRMDVTVGDATQTLRAKTDPGRERVSAQTDRNGELSVELYYENGTQYVRDAETDRYGASNATFEGAVLGFNGGEFLTVVTQLTMTAESVAREDGRTVVTYRMTGARPSAEADAASGELRVTTEGRLVSFEYEVVTGGEQLDVRWERSAVGETTVTAPDWVAQLRG